MTHLVRWDPFKEMDQTMQSFWNNWAGIPNNSSVATPVLDMFEEDGKLVIHSHLGGLTENEVDVHVDRGFLVIKGERHESDEQKNKRNYMHRESSTTVYRRIALPKDADSDNISAHLNDGILRVEIPMHEKPEPKKISIKTNKK